ncbi:MAG: biopolymer transporter ExbD [Kiritimatiellae bacterium]|nr:biopolymer transporter ExbD [Kiritimatiellia bacterium]
MSIAASRGYRAISGLRRRYALTLRRARGPVDAVPLIDAALIVFLFFLVSSAFVLQPGIAIQLPAADFSSGAPYRSMIVSISQEGMIFFNDERTTLEGLKSAFSQAVHDDPGSTLLVEADRGVPHATLVNIYNMAAAAGIEQVVVGTGLPAAEPAP